MRYFGVDHWAGFDIVEAERYELFGRTATFYVGSNPVRTIPSINDIRIWTEQDVSNREQWIALPWYKQIQGRYEHLKWPSSYFKS